MSVDCYNLTYSQKSMSSRQLCSKGELDGLSLPATTRKGKGKKSSNQPEMEQQQPDQLQQHETVQISPLPYQSPRPASIQLAMGESAILPQAKQTGQAQPHHEKLDSCSWLQ